MKHTCICKHILNLKTNVEYWYLFDNKLSMCHRKHFRYIPSVQCSVKKLSVEKWSLYFNTLVTPLAQCSVMILLMAFASDQLESWSVRMAERLALPTSDHGVTGSNPAGGEILPEPKRRFIAQSLSCSLFHRLEMTEILLKGHKTLTHPSNQRVEQLTHLLWPDNKICNQNVYWKNARAGVWEGNGMFVEWNVFLSWPYLVAA